MANERALGLSFIYATQTWRQLVMVFGEHTARSLLTLTNTVIVFGGSKDTAWNKKSPTCSAPNAPPALHHPALAHPRQHHHHQRGRPRHPPGRNPPPTRPARPRHP